MRAEVASIDRLGWRRERQGVRRGGRTTGWPMSAGKEPGEKERGEEGKKQGKAGEKAGLEEGGKGGGNEWPQANHAVGRPLVQSALQSRQRHRLETRSRNRTSSTSDCWPAPSPAQSTVGWAGRRNETKTRPYLAQKDGLGRIDSRSTNGQNAQLGGRMGQLSLSWTAERWVGSDWLADCHQKQTNFEQKFRAEDWSQTGLTNVGGTPSGFKAGLQSSERGSERR